jgi:fumarate reductase (CoM/CoB) subunit A
MHADDRVDSHVLVIGSGGAGARAALEAERYGDTILLSKTLTGKGGCTPMAEGGYNAVLRDLDGCPMHVEDTLKGGAYLNDPALVEILVAEAPDRMADLIRWGAVFDVTEEHEIAQRPFGGQRFPRTCYAGDRTGHEIMTTLVERVRASGIEQMQEFAVIDLLRDRGRVTGAIALDRSGELLVIRADAVVLATGGGTQVYDISTNCAVGTGDGFVMGYRAGAELIDMEMIQFHPTGAVYPYDARGRLITEAVRGEGGVLKNSLGERFMQRYDPERMELSTRDVVARAIATEILENRGTELGGVYLDVTHLHRSQIEEQLPIMLEQFLQFGVDIRDEPMQVAPTAHHIMGGLRIDGKARTTVPGLYACGEVTGGVHGANRLGGNALADTQVFGKRAGESAGKNPARSRSIDEAQIAAMQDRLDAFIRGKVPPSSVRNRLKEAMWAGAGIFRNAPALQATAAAVRELANAPLFAASPRNLTECCAVENMLCLSGLIVQGALLREESRGAHVRTDINQDWTVQTSPFSHTVQSPAGRRIERQEVRV